MRRRNKDHINIDFFLFFSLRWLIGWTTIQWFHLSAFDCFVVSFLSCICASMTMMTGLPKASGCDDGIAKLLSVMFLVQMQTLVEMDRCRKSC